MKNLNEEFNAEFSGGGQGWYGFRADYIVTGGVRAMTLKYRSLIGLLYRLIEIAEKEKPQSTAVFQMVITDRVAEIKLSSTFGDDYEENTKSFEYTMELGIDDCSLDIYLGIDNIFCLPCEY